MKFHRSSLSSYVAVFHYFFYFFSTLNCQDGLYVRLFVTRTEMQKVTKLYLNLFNKLCVIYCRLFSDMVYVVILAISVVCRIFAAVNLH